MNSIPVAQESITSRCRQRRCPKVFWKLMKKVLPSKNKKTQIDKITIEGIDLTDSKSIANSLKSYFTSIATRLQTIHNRHLVHNCRVPTFLRTKIQLCPPNLHKKPRLQNLYSSFVQPLKMKMKFENA